MSRDEPLPRWVAVATVLGLVGVGWYVASWAIAGALTPGHDPLRDAISELFAVGSPAAPRLVLTSGLMLSGLGLIAFAAALDRGLPGEGRLGPALAAVSGLLTFLLPAVPCTAGCPGAATSTLDLVHLVMAASAYVTLMLVPLLVAGRVRHHAPGLAHWSLLLGGLALVAFLVHHLGVEALGGLQQRIYNTAADAWYVVAALHLLRHRTFR